LLYSGKDLRTEDRHRLETVYEKSQKAILIEQTYNEANEFEKQHIPELSKSEFEPIDDIVNEYIKIPTNNNKQLYKRSLRFVDNISPYPMLNTLTQ
jgi:hypothetical protein